MGESFDVAIAGGGIVGAACAEECAAAGLKVVVVEPGPIGGGATAAGMGHIVVMDDSPAQIALTRYSRDLWMARRNSLPADVEYLPCGTLWVAADEEEMAEVQRKKAPIRRDRRAHRSAGCASLWRNRNRICGRAWPERCWCRTMQWCIRRARRAICCADIEVRRDSAVQLSGEGIRLRDGTFLAAGVTVNATGAWAPELTPGIEVRKRKGHLAITDRYPGFVTHVLVELGYLKSAHSTTADSVAFNAQPRRTGQVLLGSSRQFGSETAAIESHMLARMLRRAQEYMPEISELTAIRTWTGFRAATPDKLPLIGPVPVDSRLYLATGHEGLGITTSLATGRLVADQIMGRTPVIPAEPYLPGRKA